MTISSRTPEGTPNRCPVCGSFVCVEPSKPFGDAPCPNCGTMLWFVSLGTQPLFYDSTDERVVRFLVDRLRIDPEILRAGRWDDMKADSLDIVELVMELEESGGVS